MKQLTFNSKVRLRLWSPQVQQFLQCFATLELAGTQCGLQVLNALYINRYTSSGPCLRYFIRSSCILLLLQLSACRAGCWSFVGHSWVVFGCFFVAVARMRQHSCERFAASLLFGFVWLLVVVVTTAQACMFVSTPLAYLLVFVWETFPDVWRLTSGLVEAHSPFTAVQTAEVFIAICFALHQACQLLSHHCRACFQTANASVRNSVGRISRVCNHRIASTCGIAFLGVLPLAALFTHSNARYDYDSFSCLVLSSMLLQFREWFHYVAVCKAALRTGNLKQRRQLRGTLYNGKLWERFAGLVFWESALLLVALCLHVELLAVYGTGYPAELLHKLLLIFQTPAAVNTLPAWCMSILWQLSAYASLVPTTICSIVCTPTIYIYSGCTWMVLGLLRMMSLLINLPIPALLCLACVCMCIVWLVASALRTSQNVSLKRRIAWSLFDMAWLAACTFFLDAMLLNGQLMKVLSISRCMVDWHVVHNLAKLAYFPRQLCFVSTPSLARLLSAMVSRCSHCFTFIITLLMKCLWSGSCKIVLHCLAAATTVATCVHSVTCILARKYAARAFFVIGLLPSLAAMIRFIVKKVCKLVCISLPPAGRFGGRIIAFFLEKILLIVAVPMRACLMVYALICLLLCLVMWVQQMWAEVSISVAGVVLSLGHLVSRNALSVLCWFVKMVNGVMRSSVKVCCPTMN